MFKLKFTLTAVQFVNVENFPSCVSSMGKSMAAKFKGCEKNPSDYALIMNAACEQMLIDSSDSYICPYCVFFNTLVQATIPNATSELALGVQQMGPS